MVLILPLRATLINLHVSGPPDRALRAPTQRLLPSAAQSRPEKTGQPCRGRMVVDPSSSDSIRIAASWVGLITSVARNFPSGDRLQFGRSALPSIRAEVSSLPAPVIGSKAKNLCRLTSVGL